MNQSLKKMVFLLWPALLLLSVSVLPASGGGAKCYRCGYKEIDGQEPTQIDSDLPLCMDKPSYESAKKDCEKEDDCCAIIHIKAEQDDNVISTSTYHGCADEIKALSDSPDCANAEPGIDTSKCVKKDQNEGDNIEEDTEICLCNDELCNSYNFPTEEPGSSTTPPDGISCYMCGYMVMDNGQPQQISDDIPFCSEGGGQLKTCVKGDCCAAVEVNYMGPGGEGGKNISFFEMYHGCKDDLHIHSHTVDADCATAGDQIEEDKCVNAPFDEDGIDVDMNICVCKGDACNQWNFPTGGPTNPPTDGPVDNIECFACGYKRVGDGQPEKLDNNPFCMDEAQPGAHVVKCQKADDCCVEIHITYTENEQNIEEVWHSCKEEVGIIGFETDVLCGSAPDDINPDECASGTTGGDHENEQVQVCACKTTTCNSYIPGSTQNPQSSSEGPHKTCYNCGYMQVDGGDAQPLPDENQDFFCGDTVAPDSMTTDCVGAVDDCCAIVSEFSIKFDEASGKNTTVKAVRHGCYNELAIHEHHHIECTEATDQIEGECKSFDAVEHDNNVFKEEICLCKNDFCNNRVPTTTARPTTTTPGGGAATSKSLAALVAILVAVSIFH